MDRGMEFAVTRINQRCCNINEAIEILKEGNIVAIPTETVYGLAGAISSETAITRIFAIKNRPFFDPLIVHIADIGACRNLCAEWPKAAEVLANVFWPGPLTIVLKRNPAVNPLITAGLDSVAIRMPRHQVALDIIRGVGIPLAAPSANKFGRTSPSCAQHVIDEFWDDDLRVVDGGACEVGLESTVIGIGNFGVEIYRPGMITKEMIEHALNEKGISLGVKYQQSSASPGHLSSHYKPKKPLVLVTTKDINFNEYYLEEVKKTLNLSGSKYAELDLNKMPTIVARTLYASLRDYSESDCDFILGVIPSHYNTAASDAIVDRLRRAASIII